MYQVVDLFTSMTEETQTSVGLPNADDLFTDTFESGLFSDNLQEQRDEVSIT